MGENATTIVCHGVPSQRVWELIVTRCLPGRHVVFDTHAIRIADASGTTLILSIRPVGPDTTELSLWDAPGHGLVQALVEEPGSTVFVQREVSKGIDWESHRLMRGAAMLFACGVGPDGDRKVELAGETVFSSRDAYDSEGNAEPANEMNAEAYAQVVRATLATLSERLGDAAVVLEGFDARMHGGGSALASWRPAWAIQPEEGYPGGDDLIEGDEIPF